MTAPGGALAGQAVNAPNGTGWRLVFEDSEVRAVTVQHGQLTVHFSAAQVLPGPSNPEAAGRVLGQGLQAGHVRGLVLEVGHWVDDAADSSPMPQALGDAMGRLRQGHLWLDGHPVAPLPLDWCRQGPLRLALHFANGTVLAGTGRTARLVVPPGADVSPSYRC